MQKILRPRRHTLAPRIANAVLGLIGEVGMAGTIGAGDLAIVL